MAILLWEVKIRLFSLFHVPAAYVRHYSGDMFVKRVRKHPFEADKVLVGAIIGYQTLFSNGQRLPGSQGSYIHQWYPANKYAERLYTG